MTDPRHIAARFRAVAPEACALPFAPPPHAAIARVWMLGDRYVLRARAPGGGTPVAFERELALLDEVRGRIPWRLPDPFAADDGRRYVAVGDELWTLYPALPGRILMPWQDLHRATESQQRSLVEALRDLHRATAGTFATGNPGWLGRDVGSRLLAVHDLLSDAAAARVMRALSRLERAVGVLRPADLAFVHGDFHWGNLLVDDGGRVTGLLDLDWCRIAHPLEDLGYTAMMLLRDPELGRARLEDLPRLAEWYGVDAAGQGLLRELVLLYALFDVHLFQQASFPGRARWMELQVRVVEQVAAAFP